MPERYSLNKIIEFWHRLIDPLVFKTDYTRLTDINSLPPDLEISYMDPKRIIAGGLIALAVFFAGCFLWISLAPMTGTVIASGTVKVATERKTVQHLEGGIIKEILAKNGDQVRPGQPLVILESSQVSSAVVQLQGQLDGLFIRKARLNAEKDLIETVAWPAELKDVSGNYLDDEIKTLIESENRLFISRRQALKNAVALFDNQIEQINEQLRSFNERNQVEDRIILSVQEEIEAKEILYQDNFIDKSVILDLQRLLAEHEGIKGQLKGSAAESREKIAEIEIRRNASYEEFTERAVGELTETNNRLLDLRERLRPFEDARKRLTVTAPIGGEIVGLTVHSIGGVLAPGAPILDIVPKNSNLIVECQILVNDITKVYKGQEAEVQLSAFNPRTTPKITGRITYIAADRDILKTPYGDQAFYLIHIALDPDEIKEARLYMSAGMPAAVFINTKARTLLDYILELLNQSFDRALRED